jgi:hypothetical protein
MKHVQLAVIAAAVALALAPAAASAQNEPGAMEIGGSAGVSASMTTANVTPSVGWWLTRQLQLSARVPLSTIQLDDRDAVMGGLLVEPSYHLPFTPRAFGFFGVGAGGAYLEEEGLALAVVPRVGATFVLGDANILAPFLSYTYTAHDSNLTSTMALNLGYTRVW